MSLSGFAILVVVALLLLILVVSLYSRHHATKDLRLFSELANRRNGEIKIDSFTSWATLVIFIDEIEVTLYQQKGLGGKRTRTCLKCFANLADEHSLHIASGVSGDTSIHELGQWFLVPEVQVGSDQFNSKFTVHGNDPNFLRKIISADFQSTFLRLESKDPKLYLHTQKRSLYRSNSTESNKHLLEFSLREVPDNVVELEKIVDVGLSIIKRVINA